MNRNSTILSTNYDMIEYPDGEEDGNHYGPGLDKQLNFLQTFNHVMYRRMV